MHASGDRYAMQMTAIIAMRNRMPAMIALLSSYQRESLAAASDDRYAMHLPHFLHKSRPTPSIRPQCRAATA